MRRALPLLGLLLALAAISLDGRGATAQQSTTAACALTPESAAADPRIDANPLLASVRDHAPDKLPGLLCRLDRITTRSFSTRGIIRPATSDELAIIQANPALASGFKASPDAMLELLRRMIAAAGSTKK